MEYSAAAAGWYLRANRDTMGPANRSISQMETDSRSRRENKCEVAGRKGGKRGLDRAGAFGSPMSGDCAWLFTSSWTENLHFFSRRRGKWDKAKPYSSQVLFKFSSPLSTSCAPFPLCASRRGWFRGKKVAQKICKIAWPHAVLPRRGRLSRVFETFLGERGGC